MKVCLLSDTHRGYSPRQSKLLLDMLNEIGGQSPDLILHAGDVGSHKVDHRVSFWESLRGIPALQQTPVVFVLGNHDYWGKATYKPDRIYKDWDRFRARCLEGAEYKIPNTSISIFGFTGWYAFDSAKANDRNWIPDYVFDCFRNRADRHIEKTLSLMGLSKAKTKILLTHFDFIPNGSDGEFQERLNLLNVFSGHVDYIVSGHSHEQVNGRVLNVEGRKITYYNPGGDYLDPKYLMVNF